MVATYVPGPHGPMVFASTAGGAAPTAWKPADAAGNVTFANSNLTVGVNTNSRGNVRSVASHSTGKYYYEITLSAAPASYDTCIGAGNSTASLTNGPGSPDTNSIAYYNGDPIVYIAAGGTNNTGVTPVQGNVLGMAIDLTNNRVWVRVNSGNWNGSALADPATNTGGYDISAITGPFYALTTIGETSAGTTANFGATSYANAAPSGFGNW